MWEQAPAQPLTGLSGGLQLGLLGYVLPACLDASKLCGPIACPPAEVGGGH